MKGNQGIRYKVGFWGSDKANESSNFKELGNLVFTQEGTKEDEDGICGVEIFIFTDNEVSEGAFFKGTSTSENCLIWFLD